jgi:ABC-type thiamin/hydroxymethylpyrimidine transport system permease subunit
MLGLAVAHTLTRGSPWRTFMLSAIYAALLIFTPGAALILALAGLAETIFHYRARGDRSPSTNSDQR